MAHSWRGFGGTYTRVHSDREPRGENHASIRMGCRRFPELNPCRMGGFPVGGGREFQAEVTQTQRPGGVPCRGASGEW